MHALVQHQINKPVEFLTVVQFGAKFPEGFEVLPFLPDVSHKAATCIFEAPDTAAIKNNSIHPI